MEGIRAVNKKRDKALPLLAFPEILICIVCRFYKEHNGVLYSLKKLNT